MKKLMLSVLMVMCLAVSALAGETGGLQVDDTFEKAKKWLSGTSTESPTRC